MVTLRLPNKWFNRCLFYAGLFGLVFQLSAAGYMLWHGLALYSAWWFSLLAPLLCIGSGVIPALQLQKETT